MKTLIIGHVGLGLHALIQQELNAVRPEPKPLTMEEVNQAFDSYTRRKQRQHPFFFSEDIAKHYQDQLNEASKKLNDIKTIKLSEPKAYSPTNPYLRKSNLSGKIKYKRSIR